MSIHFGFSGNSKNLKNCSTNKTVSVAVLNNETDVIKKINKLRKVARDNILNTLKILENNKALGISVYGLSPKLFPLANYPEIEYFNYIDSLKRELNTLGEYIKGNGFRVNILLENSMIINSVSDKVLQDTLKDIKYQNNLLDYIGLDEKSKIIVNVGGAYISKSDAIRRFYETFSRLDDELKRRLALKNDDNSFSAETMIKICDKFAIPFFLSIDDKGVNSEVIKECEKSWNNADTLALLGLKANSGLTHLNGIANADVILKL